MTQKHFSIFKANQNIFSQLNPEDIDSHKSILTKNRKKNIFIRVIIGIIIIMLIIVQQLISHYPEWESKNIKYKYKEDDVHIILPGYKIFASYIGISNLVSDMQQEANMMIDKINEDSSTKSFKTDFDIEISNNPTITLFAPNKTTSVTPQKYSIIAGIREELPEKEKRINKEIENKKINEIFKPFVQKNKEKLSSYFDDFKKCECAKLGENLKSFTSLTSSSSYKDLIQSLIRLSQSDYLNDTSIKEKITTFEKNPLHDEELFFKILDAMKENMDTMKEKEDIRKEQAKKEKEEKEQREKEKKEKEEKEREERERQEAEEKRKKEAESELQSKIQRYKGLGWIEIKQDMNLREFADPKSHIIRVLPKYRSNIQVKDAKIGTDGNIWLFVRVDNDQGYIHEMALEENPNKGSVIHCQMSGAIPGSWSFNSCSCKSGYHWNSRKLSCEPF